LDGDGDHDFEEINYFNFKGKEIPDGTRRVPDLSGDYLPKDYLMFLNCMAQELGSSTNRKP
jgi:hypothetical protein